ncbi:MAG TPA: phage portal protein [Rhodocyclaceae bacterium]|nr:phage portal protein [Rhodocyclaceae bacterium]
MGAREPISWDDVQARCRVKDSVVLAQFSQQRATERGKWVAGLVQQAAARVGSDAPGMRRSFDAAETPAWTASWSTSGSTINQDLERSLIPLVSRSRELFKNDVWARRVLTLFITNVLGPQGMRLQMRIGKRGGGLHKSINETVESFWRGLGKRGKCDVSGRLSWRGVERLTLTHLVRDGEFLVRMLPGRGEHGFQVQILDPLLLDPNYRGNHAGNRIRMSVEIDGDNRPVAYWLRAQSSMGDYFSLGYGDQRRVRIPAAEILHYFVPEEADQLRGYPWITAGARRLWLLKDYEEAAAVASSNAAKRVGFFVSPNGEAPPGFADQIISAALDDAKAQGRVLSAEDLKTLIASAQKFNTVAPGQYDVIPNGYDFKAHDSQYPHINYGEYVKECLRAFIGSFGMSYATGGNNLEAVNFSSARVGIIDEREMYKILQEDFAESLHDPVFAMALRYGQLASRLLAGFPAQRYDEAIDCTVWIKRRWAGIDPVKEANASDINLRNKLTSPQRIIAERGDDWEEIAEEIEQWEERVGPVGSGSTQAQADLAGEDEVEPAADDGSAKPDDSTNKSQARREPVRTATA